MILSTPKFRRCFLVCLVAITIVGSVTTFSDRSGASDMLASRLGLSYADRHLISAWSCTSESEWFSSIKLYGVSESELGLIEFEGLPRIDARYTLKSPYDSRNDSSRTLAGEIEHRWGWVNGEGTMLLWTLADGASVLKKHVVRSSGQHVPHRLVAAEHVCEPMYW